MSLQRIFITYFTCHYLDYKDKVDGSLAVFLLQHYVAHIPPAAQDLPELLTVLIKEQHVIVKKSLFGAKIYKLG